jgi:hypothetical protein
VPFRKPWPPRLRFGQNPARDVDNAGSPYRRDAFRRIFRRPSSGTALQARTSCSCLELSTHGIEVAGGKSAFREAVPKAGEAVRKSRRFACLRLVKHVLSAEVCSSF